MQTGILALLDLFRDYVRDRDSNADVTELISDRSRWIEAHSMFCTVRDRLLTATGDAGRPAIPEHLIDHSLVAQYRFEESCLKSIYNESEASYNKRRLELDLPYTFDSCAPFWVAGNAIILARRLDRPISDVLEILAPSSDHEL